MLELIEKKAAGQEVVTPVAHERPAPVIDLMAALEASLAQVKDARSGKAGGEAVAASATAADGDADAGSDEEGGDGAAPAKGKKAAAKKAASGRSRKAS